MRRVIAQRNRAENFRVDVVTGFEVRTNVVCTLARPNKLLIGGAWDEYPSTTVAIQLYIPNLLRGSAITSSALSLDPTILCHHPSPCKITISRAAPH